MIHDRLQLEPPEETLGGKQGKPVRVINGVIHKTTKLLVEVVERVSRIIDIAAQAFENQIVGKIHHIQEGSSGKLITNTKSHRIRANSASGGISRHKSPSKLDDASIKGTASWRATARDERPDI